MKRREFLKAGAGLAAGSLLRSPWSWAVDSRPAGAGGSLQRRPFGKDRIPLCLPR